MVQKIIAILTIISSFPKGKLGDMKQFWTAIGVAVVLSLGWAMCSQDSSRVQCIEQCKPDVAISYSPVHCQCGKR